MQSDYDLENPRLENFRLVIFITQRYPPGAICSVYTEPTICKTPDYFYKRNSMSHKSSKLNKNETRGSESWKFHKDWRVWIAVIFMLIAMFTYVLTLDEAAVPKSWLSFNNSSGYGLMETRDNANSLSLLEIHESPGLSCS